jgi:hypothetical protein
MDIVLRTVVIFAIILITGCASRRITHTTQSGVEEMLLSTAIDEAIAKYDSTNIYGKRIYIDSSNLYTIKDTGTNGYIIGVIRSSLGKNGAVIVDKKEDAEIMWEIYNWTVGTDYNDSFIGIPPIGIPIVFSGTLMTPKIAFYEKSSQTGTCKLLINLFDIATGKQIVTKRNVLGQTHYIKHSLMGYSWRHTDIYKDKNPLDKNKKE